jgi:hypothetical protein
MTVTRKLGMTAVMTLTLVSAACTSSTSSQLPRPTRVSRSASIQDRALSPRRQSAQVPSTVSQSLLGRIA